MIITAPVTDYIPASVLTTLGDIVQRGAANPERRALRSVCHIGVENVQVIPDITWTVVGYDQAIYDRNTDFNLVTHQFLVPRDGEYLVLINISWVNFNDGVVMRSEILGGALTFAEAFSRAGGNGDVGHTTHGIISASVGEHIWARVYQSSGGNESLGALYNTIDIIELY